MMLGERRGFCSLILVIVVVDAVFGFRTEDEKSYITLVFERV